MQKCKRAAGKAAGFAVTALTGATTHDQLTHADLVVYSLHELAPAVFRDLLSSLSRKNSYRLFKKKSKALI
jgi:hypothetical protein